MKYRARFLTTLCILSLSAPTLAQQNTQQNNDPYEKYNRFMFKINNKADRYVIAPVARTYKKITPKPIRTATTNVMNNLRDVVSFGSNLLRGEFGKAGNDFMRVSINTTFGLGGLINWADAAEMPNNKNHLGDTFATWGWKNSNYFVYPILGPSTVRDSLGNTITTVYSPNQLIIPNHTARYSVAALNGIDTRANLLELTDNIEKDALEPYVYTRNLYMAYRNNQVNPKSDEEIMNEMLNQMDEDDDNDDVPNNSSPSNDENQTNHNDINQSSDDVLEFQTDAPTLQLNSNDVPLIISPEAQHATQEYIDLWQHQAQNNTAFY